MLRQYRPLLIVLAAVALFAVAGCGTNPPAADKVPSVAEQPGEHDHKPGTHGGFIVEIGRDNYHAEPVFEKDGVLRVYLLGKDEARVEEVEAQTLTAYAKPEGSAEAIEFSLKPAPRPDDAPGKTSVFAGTLPQKLWGKRVEVTVPSIRIAGERFRFGFKNAVADAEHQAGMPAKVSDDEERKLYLTPAGKYTEADIKANGKRTASERFKGQMASHDLSPRPGDKICPITLTKANAKFTWVVGGKQYEFCCPPCVDEFVQTAKEKPDEIKEPADYVKK
jgi:YHS domain-containing protein